MTTAVPRPAGSGVVGPEPAAVSAADAVPLREAPLPRAPFEVATTGGPGGAGLLVGDIIAALRRRIRLAAAVVIASGLVGVGLAFREEPTFTATAVVRIGDARRALTSGIEETEAPVDRLASPLLSQIQLLRSRTLIGSVVDSTGLRLVPDFSGFRPRLLRDVQVAPDAPAGYVHLRFGRTGLSARFAGWTADVGYGSAVDLGPVRFVVDSRPVADSAVWRVVPRERAIDALLTKLKVKPRTQTNFVDVSYSARRPTVAQRVVNTVAASFQAASAGSAQEQSRRRRVFLAEQVEMNSAELDRAQRALSAFRRGAQVYGSSDQMKDRQRDLDRLSERASALEAEQRVYASLYATLSSAPAASRLDALRALVGAPGVRDNPAVMQLYQQLSRQVTIRDSLTTGAWRAADTDPDVQRSQELIRTAESQLHGAVRGHLAWLEAQRRSLDAVRDRGESTLGALSSVEAEELRLEEDVAAARRIGEALRADYQRARMAEAVELGPVELVDMAALPYEPNAMMRVLKVVLALGVGLGLGIALALILEMRNETIRSTDEIERVLQVPGLGVVPRTRPDETLAALGDVVPRLHALPVNQKRLARRDEQGSVVRRATLMEAFRVLRTNLLFARAGQSVRSLVVTSAAPSEGKTTTAANLAIMCAAAGMRVLLVDCDLPRARVHRLFGHARMPGLTQVLQGTALTADAIRETRAEGLWILPAGPRDGGGREALRSARMRGLLGVLVDRFDLVILDTPPVLAGADASVLAALGDGVLLVVHAGHTTRADARLAVAQLDRIGAPVIGAVLNGAPPETVAYPRYYAAYHQPALAT